MKQCTALGCVIRWRNNLFFANAATLWRNWYRELVTNGLWVIRGQNSDKFWLPISQQWQGICENWFHSVLYTYQSSALPHSNFEKTFSAKKTELPTATQTKNLRKHKHLPKSESSRYRLFSNGAMFTKNELFLHRTKRPNAMHYCIKISKNRWWGRYRYRA